ncbi:ketohexokinase [Patella vulgata]|uniref:ketohexokinase n=1 Tax=Patella vulgata TaxID=6465 RepID=UPI00217FBD60|nr:ketohexokinase [Patella vulgata]XP_050419439.1 ketohexokinase [Patella vulgata]
MDTNKTILCVGLVCIDLKTIVKTYPLEDSGQRTLDTIKERGGNASNTATVLSSIGCNVEFLGTVADCENINFLRSDCNEFGINIENCAVCPRTKCPLSIVIINTENGSRTILHSNKSLRELKCEDFKKLDLKKYKWIHFEGRPNKDEIYLMMNHVRRYNKSVDDEDKIVISLEIEKIRPILLDDLIELADYTFLSKDYAQFLGYDDMTSCVRGMSETGKTIFCAWGEQGAAAKIPDGPVVTSKAFKPPQVIDTTGAGDTFIAGCIYSLCRNLSLGNCVEIGCRLAGAKCGIMGLKDIHSVKKMILNKIDNF